MRLEVGKTYQKRNREFVMVVRENYVGLEFVGEDGFYYRPDGQWFLKDPGVENPEDIIAEVLLSSIT